MRVISRGFWRTPKLFLPQNCPERSEFWGQKSRGSLEKPRSVDEYMFYLIKKTTSQTIRIIGALVCTGATTCPNFFVLSLFIVFLSFLRCLGILGTFSAGALPCIPIHELSWDELQQTNSPDLSLSPLWCRQQMPPHLMTEEPERLERDGPCWLLKLRWMGT
jgi:hypothetical protein